MGSSILVVDDALNLQALLGELFARKSISVRFAAEGEVALECARQEWPRIVLLDLTLQGRLDGWEVWQALRNRSAGRPLRVRLFTASLSDAEAVRAEECGAFGVIKKPVSVCQMMQEIQRAVTSLGEGASWAAPIRNE